MSAHQYILLVTARRWCRISRRVKIKEKGFIRRDSIRLTRKRRGAAATHNTQSKVSLHIWLRIASKHKNSFLTASSFYLREDRKQLSWTTTNHMTSKRPDLKTIWSQTDQDACTVQSLVSSLLHNYVAVCSPQHEMLTPLNHQPLYIDP